jgi:hypothetical protein
LIGPDQCADDAVEARIGDIVARGDDAHVEMRRSHQA